MKGGVKMNFAALIFPLLLPAVYGKCSNEFAVTSQTAPAELQPLGDFLVTLNAEVRETLPLKSTLYILSWKSNTTQDPELDDQSANEAKDYVKYTLFSENKTMEFLVDQLVAGLIDYNTADRKITLSMNINFYFNGSKEVCKLEITNELIDENTQEPHFTQTSYNVTIREDLPVQMPIPGLEPIAYDYDAELPNNEFDVKVNKGCPLQPVQWNYTCNEGNPVYVQFILVQTLDYDVMAKPFQYNCNVTLVNDLEDASLTSFSTITVNVEGSRDEEPAFTSDYYKGYVVESIKGAVVDVNPFILATDSDKPSSKVVYTMKPTDEKIGSDQYFKIDPDSGNITITKDIDSEFMSYQQVEFFLSACDADSQCSTSFLVIVVNAMTCDQDYLQFERVTYTTQVLSPEKGEEVIRVHAQTSGNEDELIYYFANNSSYFDIDNTTGVIITTTDQTPFDHYVLIAMVTDGSFTDQATVNIEILLGKESIVLMNESVTMKNITEDYTGLLLTVHAEGAGFFCIEGILPNQSSDSFQLDSSTGELEVVGFLDADPETASLNPLFTNKYLLKIAAYKDKRECEPFSSTTQLKSHECLVAISVSDMNEYPPYFVDITNVDSNISSILYAYPENELLRKAIGQVATVLAEDPDRTSYLTFSILNSGDFVIDENSGEIYFVGEDGCEEKDCHFVVAVDDTEYQSNLSVTVTTLDLNHIFTLTSASTDVDEVDSNLRELSQTSGMSIYLLYTNILETSTISTDAKTKWKIEAQVYATYNSQLVDLAEFNKHLNSSGDVKIAGYPFSDRSYYEEIILMNTSVIIMNIMENDTGPLLTVQAEGAKFFCIEGILPNQSSDSFRLDSSTGELEVVGFLDADPETGTLDPLFTNKYLIKIAAYNKETECDPFRPITQLKSHECLVAISVSDINEHPPYFVDITNVDSKISSILYAYPEDELLRKTIGPVATVLAEDPDRTSYLTFSILDSGDFVIDENSGEIYFVGEDGCEEKDCHFVVAVDDTEYQSNLSVTVTSLDFNHIFTLNFGNIDIDEVEGTLREMSRASGMSIYLLYTNVLGTQTKSTAKATHWKIEAHVYATYKSELVKLEDFNKYLESSEEIKQQGDSFSDEGLYVPADSTPVAAIVLGCILGLLLLILAGLACYYCCRKSTEENNYCEGVKTLSQAYDNPNLKEDRNRGETTFSAIFGDSTAVPKASQSTSLDWQNESQVKEKLSASLNTNADKTDHVVNPPSPIITKYEAEIDRAAASISKALGPNKTKSARAASTSSSEKDSLNTSSTETDDQKSVAFKVLVETKEIDTKEERNVSVL